MFRKNKNQILTIALAALMLLGAILLKVYFKENRYRFSALRSQNSQPNRPRPANGAQRREPVNGSPQLMTLDPTGKYLIDSRSNKPVFITGDAAWSLQVQLSNEEVQLYLTDRASRGFNVILVNLVDNYYSDHAPYDYYGNAPFSGPDFTHANPAYWARVDQTVSWAATRGITILADPAFVGYGCAGGYCQSYRKSSLEVVKAYGEFLGARYKHASNIIWLIGGDADPKDREVNAKLNALASGIRSKDPTHLITSESYRGESSSYTWPAAEWLDLNALYSEPEQIPNEARESYVASTLPAFLLEDWYEGEHATTGAAARKEGYVAVLSGCTLGRVFGNFAIWNFSWSHNTMESWKKQLDSEGSLSQAWLGKLFRSREHWKLVPDFDHAVVTCDYGLGQTLKATREAFDKVVLGRTSRTLDKLCSVGRTDDGQSIIVYSSGDSATKISVDLSKIADPKLQAKCWWFNPKTGSANLIGIFPTSGRVGFTPPDRSDWVLVIDGASANLRAPAADITL